MTKNPPRHNICNMRWAMSVCIALIFGTIATGLAACLTPTITLTTTEVPTMDAQSYQVRANTQLTVEDLRIGVGNLREGSYVDAQGAPQHGLTAGLWLYVRDDPSQNRQVRVYAGQTITVSKYVITITDINAGSHSVQFRISATMP